MSAEFDQFAADRVRRATSAEIGVLVTDEDRAIARALTGVGNAWTRERYGGKFYLLPAPPRRPAICLVMVQSSDGNTGARNPAVLGGGDIDLHLVYEGLSRVAADGVLAGSRTARGRVFFSIWHPQIVSLRIDLGLPRHPAQIVISRNGHLDVDATLLFNVPDLPVFVLAGPACRERCRSQFSRRPWLTVLPIEDHDIRSAFDRLHERGIRRISAVGGRTTASALVDAGLVQDLCLTTTSQQGGEPGTPWYTGKRVIELHPIVRKHSAGGGAGRAIHVDHHEVRVAL